MAKKSPPSDLAPALGNLHDPAVHSRLVALRDAGSIPADNGLAAWLSWWRDLPEPLRLSASTVTLIYLTYFRCENGKISESGLGALARDVPREVRKVAIDTARRAAEVERAIADLPGEGPAMGRLRQLLWQAALGERLDRLGQMTGVLLSAPVLVTGEPATGRAAAAQALALGMPGTWDPSGGWCCAPVEVLSGDDLGNARLETVMKRNRGGAVVLRSPGETSPRWSRAVARAAALAAGASRLIVTCEADGPGLQPLAALEIRVPPLRERPEDLQALGEREAADMVAPELLARTRQGLEAFLAGPGRGHGWPGNLQELRAAVAAIALGLPPAPAGQSEASPADDRAPGLPDELVQGAWTLEQAKAWYARHVAQLSATRTAAAATLKVDRATLRKYLA